MRRTLGEVPCGNLRPRVAIVRCMNTFDEDSEAEALRDDQPRAGQLEKTDIDADELLDGEVDAEGASAIRHRNE